MPTSGEIVRAYVEAIGTRQMSNAVPFLAPDVVFDNVPLKGDARLCHGAEAVGKRLQPLLDLSEKVEWEIVRQIEQGDTVFNERVDRFWFKPGTFPGGDLFECPVATRWELRDGLIVLWKDFYEAGLCEPQLGVDAAEFGRRIQIPQSAS